MPIMTSLTSGKNENEPLQSLINRVENIIKNIKDLHSNNFNLKFLDEKLASMSFIRALPAEEYSLFISSLYLLLSLHFL